MCTVRILRGKFHKFDQIPEMKHWGSFHHTVLSLKGLSYSCVFHGRSERVWLCKTTLLSYPVHLQCYTYKCIHVATWCMRCSHVCTCMYNCRKEEEVTHLVVEIGRQEQVAENVISQMVCSVLHVYNELGNPPLLYPPNLSTYHHFPIPT